MAAAFKIMVVINEIRLIWDFTSTATTTKPVWGLRVHVFQNVLTGVPGGPVGWASALAQVVSCVSGPSPRRAPCSVRSRSSLLCSFTLE